MTDADLRHIDYMLAAHDVVEITIYADGIAALRAMRAEIERLRALIPVAKEARKVAACFSRVLNSEQIDTALDELAEMGIRPAFGTRLEEAIEAAEAGEGEK